MGRSCQTLQRSLSFSPVDPWLFVVGTETGTSEHVFSLGGAAGAAGADDGFFFCPSVQSVANVVPRLGVSCC